MTKREVIKDFYGRILGYIDTDSQGNKTVRDFHFYILGYYKKAQDITTNFYGKILARGDHTSMLIPMN